jgi:hypothetical protein
MSTRATFVNLKSMLSLRLICLPWQTSQQESSRVPLGSPPAAALLILASLCSANAAFAQSTVWTKTADAQIAVTAPRQIKPSNYTAFRLDLNALNATLAVAPLERSVAARASTVVITLPMASGALARFSVSESPIMEPALAARFPEIRTYAAQGIDDPSASARIDVTPAGFHAQVLTNQGTYYVDPYQANDTKHYIAYDRATYTRSNAPALKCDVHGDKHAGALVGANSVSTARLVSGTQLRTYRLAVGATGEYTAFQGGTVVAALSGIITTVNRVNGIYERDVAVRMVLVANNDRIIFTNAITDPYTNNDGPTLLGENQAIVDQQIGAANYDIGHVFSTGGGGVASLGSVCGGGKARGVTGSPAPIGDAFDVDYVAHEMGHQFGGPHTFNSSLGSCGGANRSASNAYETGSGTTIMAYAGICGAENLQPNSDDYFHRASLTSILNFVAAGGSCAAVSATGNTPPVVSAPLNTSIPARTPFALTATGSDSDSDTLSYLWEQFDLGAATAGGALLDDGTRPLFRPLDLGPSPTRVFPALRYILNNANAVPATAPLPGSTGAALYTGESLPTTSRTLNFRVTVRDNRAGGGGTNEASTALSVVATAGPFAITAPNAATSIAAGTPFNVTWNVASTDVAPINTSNVRISLSRDGGNTFPVILAANAANSGSASVVLPANESATNQARVKVEAIGNVYFDISDADFAITAGFSAAPTVGVSGSLSTRQGSPASTQAVATISGQGTLSLSLAGAPPELVTSVNNTAGTVNLTAAAACTLAYPLLLTVTDSQNASTTAQVVVNVAANQQPSIGNYTGATLARSASVTLSPSTPMTDPNNNLALPTVLPATLPGGGTLSIAANGNVTVTTGATTPFATYRVRAVALDTCGAARTAEFDVVVASPDPVINQSSPLITSGNALLEPNECNEITIPLSNIGTSTATAVNSVLSSATPGITIARANSGYANIANGSVLSNTQSYRVSTASTATCFTSANFTQTVTYAGGAGSPTVFNFSLPIGRPLATNYGFTPSSGGVLGATGDFLVGTRDDDATAPFNLPFAVQVYGSTFSAGTAITISTNGNVQFAATGSSDWSNTSLPVLDSDPDAGSGAFPASAPTIFAYWDDLDLRATTSGVYTEVTGTAPNRVLKIEWRGTVIAGAGVGPAVDFALLLTEGSNLFSTVYSNATASAASGASATIGVQGAATGTVFTVYALNNTAAVSPGVRLTSSFAPAICVTGPGVCSTDGIFENGFE